VTEQPAYRRKPTRIRPSIDEVAAQIAACKGFLTPAAAALGVSRGSLDRMVSRSSRLAWVCKQARESMVDYAESKLFKRIEADDTRAIIFCLSTLGKHRGYAMAKGTELNLGDTINAVTIGSVVIQPVRSGEFVGSGQVTIEHESLGGGLVDDYETKKLG
jgi:hypothetical protein